MKKMINFDGILESPPKSLILDVSPQFLKLLGYNNLMNSYLPDLVPKNHHIKIDQRNISVKINNVKGLMNPKLQCIVKNAFFKHGDGHFINIDLKAIFYFVIKKQKHFLIFLSNNKNKRIIRKTPLTVISMWKGSVI